MFSKAKPIPNDAFIAKPARMMAIGHLCLAFTVLLFILGYPYMGRHYALKSRLLVYDAVVNADSFATLDPEGQKRVTQERNALQAILSSLFMDKTSDAIKRLFHVPGFKMAWIALSIVLPIFILIKKEGAAAAAWILPLLALAYAIDNQQNGWTPVLTEEEKLFPPEKDILEHYVKKKLEHSFLSQREELLQGWHHYLIQEWAQQIPHEDPSLFKQQLTKGEFAFNLARLNALAKEPIKDNLRQKEPLIVLLLYVAWNLYFAYFINKRKWKLS